MWYISIYINIYIFPNIYFYRVKIDLVSSVYHQVVLQTFFYSASLA